MSNIQGLIAKNRFAISELLRQNNVIYTDIQDGIRKGIETKGDSFNIKLVNILSKGSPASNFNEGTDEGPVPPSGSYVDENGVTIVPGASGSSGKIWDTWSNLLKYVGLTGTTYSQFMTDVSGAGNSTTMNYENTGSKQTWLYWAAGILILILVLVLIFKK